MTFLAVLVGSALGTFIGGSALLWLIGNLAAKQQKKQAAELQALQNQYLATVQKETERMQKYAAMEG